jgi:energy-coupling factor transporter ATP-binding protein EcfA2
MSSTDIVFDHTAVRLSSGHKLIVSGRISFNAGDTVLVLGDNGSGKTTFLTLMQSLLEGEPRGSILRIDWEHVIPAPTRTSIVHVFQEPRENFVSRCSADEIILPLLSPEYSADVIVDRLRQLIDAADVHRQGLFRRPIDLLSAGEQQRIAICAALAAQPSVMLWDEALERIDDKTAAQIERLLAAKGILRETVLFVSTHRPQRYSRIFRNRITSVIYVSKSNDNVTLDQLPFRDEMIFPGQTTDAELNFCTRPLWERYVDNERITPERAFFNNGFRIFSSKAQPIMRLGNFEIHSRDLTNVPLAPLAKAVLTRKVNFVIGRNGSGKTLFLRYMAGHFPTNPIFPSLKRMYAAASVELIDFATPPAIRRTGRSIYMPGEPFRWITEDSVEAELGRYHDGITLQRRYSILGKYGITKGMNPETLSYGQRKMVCLLSLPENLDVVCLDEPFSDMSIPLIEETEHFIDSMIQTSNWKCVLISHASDLA